MIAYLMVIHLFLSLPTPMWFSNPEVITFWQKFIGTSVFFLRSAGHCVTLAAAQQRAAVEKPNTVASQGQVMVPGQQARGAGRKRCPQFHVLSCLVPGMGSV